MMASPEGPAAVSTLKEAEQFAAGGVRDILYAVGIVPAKLDRVSALRARGVDLMVVVDSVEAAQAVAAHARLTNDKVPALIEIDDNGHRSGVDATDAKTLLEIGRTLADGAELRGVMIHAGSSYACRDHPSLVAAAERERETAVAAATILRSAGLPCPVRQRRVNANRLFGDRPFGRHRGARRRLCLLRSGDGRTRCLQRRRHRHHRAGLGDRRVATPRTSGGRRGLDGPVARSGHGRAVTRSGIRAGMRPGRSSLLRPDRV